VRYGLDTNVVLRLLMNDVPEQTNLARAFLDRLEATGQRATISDLVVTEAYYGLRHHLKVPTEAALFMLSQILSDPAITGESAPSVLRDLTRAAAPPGFIDQLLLAHHRDHHTTLLTFDRTLGALPGTELLAGA
jgi:predicted nucleic acid-binding protein